MKKKEKKPEKKPELEWKRAVKDETIISKRRHWHSRCGRYTVVQGVSKLCELGTHYSAISAKMGLLKTHRTRKAAERTCNLDNNNR